MRDEPSKEMIALVHKSRVNKYPLSDPVGLLMRMIEEIRMKTHHSSSRCWDLMVEAIAKWLVLNDKIGLAQVAPMKAFHGLKLEKDVVYRALARAPPGFSRIHFPRAAIIFSLVIGRLR